MTIATTERTITDHEAAQVERANASRVARPTSVDSRSDAVVSTI